MAFSGRYDPSTLDDLVIDSDNREVLEMFVEQKLTGHLILEGTNGTGKTSIVNLLPKLRCPDGHNLIEVYGDSKFQLNQKLLEDWDRMIAYSRFYSGPLFIVINEIEQIASTTPLFWQWLDTKVGAVTVIGTTNRLMVVPKALRSRMRCLSFQPVTASAMMDRAREIMQSEGVLISDADLLRELESVEMFGDIRKYLDRLEIVAALYSPSAPNAYVSTKPAPASSKVIRAKKSKTSVTISATA